MRPADFTLRFEWRAGTMPPPHHYHYTMQIWPNQSGEIQFCPDYAVNEPPVWTEKFKVAEEAVDALYQALLDKKIMGREWPEPEEQMIGGSLQWLEFSAHGHHFSVPPRLTPADTAVMADLYRLIRTLVPADVWATLNSRHEAYKQKQ
jgi:hypothetical protein